MIEIRHAETEADLDHLHEFAVAKHDPEYQCSAGIPYPSRKAFSFHLEHHHIAIAEEKGETLAFAIYEDGGRVRWLVSTPGERWMEAGKAVVDYVQTVTGNAHGTTNKPETITRLQVANPTLTTPKDGMVQW